jgi:hypothetical protein
VASAVELVTNAAHGVSCTLLDMWNCLNQFPVGFRPAVDALRSSQQDAHEAVLHLLDAVSAFDDDLLSEYTSFTSQKIHCLSCDKVSQGACLATTNFILPVTRSVQHSLNSLAEWTGVGTRNTNPMTCAATPFAKPVRLRRVRA